MVEMLVIESGGEIVFLLFCEHNDDALVVDDSNLKEEDMELRQILSSQALLHLLGWVSKIDRSIERDRSTANCE
jgi:hypothetical protein